MTENLPKISCLTITKNRLALLKQAIQCFANQSYPNKELVIVSDGDNYFNASVQRYLDNLEMDNVIFKTISDTNNSLGKLRNLAWDSATGDFVCQWDDDDQYHPKRLEIQYLFLKEQGAHATFLVEQLQLFRDDQILFLADWPAYTKEIRRQLIPGTLLAYNSDRFRYPESGNVSHNGEDDALIDQMTSQGMSIAGLSGEAGLYLYQYHGSNKFSKKHHLDIAINCSASEEKVLQQMDNIFQALQQYNVPMPLGIYAGNRQIAVYNRIARL